MWHNITEKLCILIMAGSTQRALHESSTNILGTYLLYVMWCHSLCVLTCVCIYIIGPLATSHLCCCFSLSEHQHLRTTRQCPEHDDVICQQPAAPTPVHRWQRCTLQHHMNPVNPVPHKQWHTCFEFIESLDHCCYWFLCAAVVFCPLWATKFHTWRKNKVNIELSLTSAPAPSRGGLT